MPDTYGKYLRLLSLILLLFIGIIGFFALLLFVFKWFFRLIDMASVTSSIYLFVMLLIPAAIFISIYSVFYKRTKKYPNKTIRIISNVIFMAGIISWLLSVGVDMVTFFNTGNADTSYYHSFDKWMLIPNGVAIFVAGIIQALAMPEDKDWVNRKS